MTLHKFSRGKTDQWAIGTDIFGLQEFMVQSVPEGQLDLLTWNILAGITEPIDPFLEFTGDRPFCSDITFELWPAASPVLLALSQVLEVNHLPDVEVDWQHLTETPEAVSFQISHQWVRTCFVPQNALELARIITPHDRIGIIKSIQTELTFRNYELDPPQAGLPSGLFEYRWPRGDSAYHKRILSSVAGLEVGDVDVEWAVKIESLNVNSIPNRYAFRAQAVVAPVSWLSVTPGTVHPEISPWKENIFLMGCDHYVRLRCPPGSIVSLWIYFAGPTTVASGVWATGGIMKAQHQKLMSCRTYHNVTEMD